MPKGSRYCRISQQEFEEFLGVKSDGKPLEKGGFYRIDVPGTYEIVYSKKVGPDLSLRVYSTIENGQSREKDSDAIRVTIVWRPTQEEQSLMLQDGVIGDNVKWPLTVGGESKVLRIPTWRKNLGERLKNYEDILPPRCSCGCPKVYRKPKKSKGQTWEPFWGCVLSKNCPAKTRKNKAREEVKVSQNTRTPQREPLVSVPKKWNHLPEWKPIPEERRRPGSKILYNEPPY